MPDIFSKEKRSEVMSRIKGKNTGPEKEVFRFLRQHKIYFQKHYKRAPGCPDIALPRKKKAVFIDGAFWHGYDFEKRQEKMVMENREYWLGKIQATMARDERQVGELEAKGWRVLRVWDHRLARKADKALALEEIAEFLLG